MMLKTMFDGNQTSFNNFQHHTTWWPNEYNVFDSTMLDDGTLTCSVDSFGQVLTARKVIVDESKKKNLYPSKPPHSVRLQYHQFPSSRLFLRIFNDDNDDDDDVKTEFATSCPLLVL